MWRLLAALLCWPAWAGTLVTWTAPTTLTDGSPIGLVDGYKVYAGQLSGQYTQVTTVSGQSAELTLGAGRWHVAVTTLAKVQGEQRESAYSAEVSTDVPADPPAQPVLTLALLESDERPVVFFDISPNPVATNGTITIRWEAQRASSCLAVGSNWSGPKGVGPDSQTRTVRVPSVYSITCDGAGGATQKTIFVDTF